MCDFCYALNQKKKLDRIAKKQTPFFSHRYSVAIVQRMFIKGRRDCQGRITDYKNTGCGYKLNYCPECGKKMQGGAHDDTTGSNKPTA